MKKNEHFPLYSADIPSPFTTENNRAGQQMSRPHRLPPAWVLTLLLITTALIGLVLTPEVHAADNTIFINKCGQCHKNGAQAAPINPADKAGLVWIKYFKRQRHPVDLSKLISSSEMENVLTYLQEHAADSERPVAAAIPK